MESSNGLRQYFREIWVGGRSLVIGLWITFQRLFKRIVTVQYPRQKLTMVPNFRGHIEALRFDDNNSHHCVACGLCARICPSHVIKVQGVKSKASAHKRGSYYYIDFTKCSLCGLCVDVCPEKTLTFSHEFELAYFSRWDGVIDIMKRLEESRS